MEHALQTVPEGDSDYSSHLNNLVSIYRLAFKSLGGLQYLEKSISFGEQALQLVQGDKSASLKWFDILGEACRRLFERSGRLEDIDRSIGYLEKALTLTPDGDEELASRFNELGASNHLLFERLGRIEDLHKALNCMERAVFLTPGNEHENKHTWLNNLGIAYESLFKRLGRLDDMKKAIHCAEQAVLLLPDDHEDKPSWLSNLGGAYTTLFSRLGRLEDIYKSIGCLENAMLIAARDHPDWPFLFENSGVFEHIYKAIGCLEQAIRLTPDDHPDRSSRLNHLGRFHFVLSNRTNKSVDLVRAMLVLKDAAFVPLAPPVDKLKAARGWASIAGIVDSGSQLEAWTRTMELLPQVAWLGVSVNRRYETLTKVEAKAIGMQAAAGAIEQRRYDLAIEWLEQGRSVVWGQTLQLRAQFKELDSVDPMMAEQLRQVSYELERASTHHSVDRTLSQSSGAESDVAQRHRRLAETWERLLERVRLLPGLDSFLRPKASNLINLVRDGIVVIVNVHFSRCDALCRKIGNSMNVPNHAR
ncbi:hypothetical protein FRC07_005634 [Ceratobasidium sp. 392]|nr:hypothetical protein FRC07_005634 [Ceratobasidium sp. 392]